MGLQNTGKFRADKSSKYEGGAGNRLNKVFLHLSEWFIQFVCCFFLSGKEDGAENRIARMQENNAVDEKYGFLPPKESGEKIGYLINMHIVILKPVFNF